MSRIYALSTISKFTMALMASLTVTLLGAVVAIGGPANAERPVNVTLDPDAIRASIDYLTSTYKVDEAEALRRLQLQKDAQDLDGVLRREHPGEYGGMWLDQDHGGVLNVAMTNPSIASSYILGMMDGTDVRTIKVARSLTALNAVRDRLAKEVGEGPDAIYLPAIDMIGNQVVLWKRDWVSTEKVAGTWDSDSLRAKTWETTLAGRPPAHPDAVVAMPSNRDARRQAVAAEAATANSAVVAEGGVAVLRTLAEPEALYTPFVDWGFCHPLYCHPYYGGMRGGLGLDSHCRPLCGGQDQSGAHAAQRV